eukprot:scaffold291727_cov33-Tisochrysis_lutea.AAC.2
MSMLKSSEAMRVVESRVPIKRKARTIARCCLTEGPRFALPGRPVKREEHASVESGVVADFNAVRTGRCGDRLA